MGDVWQECMDHGVEVVKEAGKVKFRVFVYILEVSGLTKTPQSIHTIPLKSLWCGDSLSYTRQASICERE